MPWDYRVIEYRPRSDLSSERRFQLNQMVEKKKASYWRGDRWGQPMPLWELFPEEFVPLEHLINVVSSLVASCLPLVILEMIADYSREECQFPEIIYPKTCQEFVWTAHSDQNVWPLARDYDCGLRYGPDDLRQFAMDNLAEWEKELSAYTTVRSPMELFLQWKQLEHARYDDSKFYLQRVLFCYQAAFLSSHGFSAVCEH